MEVRVFKNTSDQWYPSYYLGNWYNGVQPGGSMVVEVSFLQTGPADTKSDWRVCVWGADDCGMEKDFDQTKEAEAWLCFLEVIGLEDVTRTKLMELGFVSA